MMDNMNIWSTETYNVQLVADDVYAIDELGVSICYLVVGRERAALIDTASGFGDLRPVTDRLTDKEVIVLNTHGHVDHVGGNGRYAHCCMDERDIFLLREYFTPEGWVRSAHKAMKENPALHIRTDNPPHIDDPRPLDHGGYDLGGRFLEVIGVPGHTPGSVVFLDKANRLLFSGDAIVSTPILIFDRYSATIREFLQGLEAVEAREADFDLIFPGHYLRPISKVYLRGLIRCAQTILDGTAPSEPIDFSHMSDEKAVLYRYDRASIACNEKHIR